MSGIRSNLFDFTTVKRKPHTGSLMVAEPFLRERYFLHSVVSLLDCEEGQPVMGTVLNNRTELMLHDVLDNLNHERHVPVYCGGPVAQDRLYFIHSLGSEIIPDANEYAPGMYVGGDFDAIIEYINSGYPVDGIVRFFLGYTGWSIGQLDAELDNDVWAVAPPHILNAVTPAELLSLQSDRMWHRVVREMGAPYRLWQLHPATVTLN